MVLASGSVLVVGGIAAGNTFLSSAELYNPYAGSFSGTGAMSAARSGQTATLLPSGNVLVAGGFNGSTLAGAEMYVPGSGSFAATGGLLAARSGQTATLLRTGGKLLMAGGSSGAASIGSSELCQ